MWRERDRKEGKCEGDINSNTWRGRGRWRWRNVRECGDGGGRRRRRRNGNATSLTALNNAHFNSNSTQILGVASSSSVFRAFLLSFFLSSFFLCLLNARERERERELYLYIPIPILNYLFWNEAASFWVNFD